MTEHKRNIMITDCLEAQAHYMTLNSFISDLLAEVYLMRSETIING
jgi:hypothetical protein